MQVTVFNGSPRGPKSNSHLIAKALLEGARQAGAQTEEVFLIQQDIKHCRGCFSCWGNTPGICIIKDDMAALMDLYLESDYVGMATPVYGMLMTGLLKNFTDRFLPLATPHIRKNEDGSFYHQGRVKHFPRQFFVANSGFPGAHNFDLLKAYYEMAKKAGESPIVLEVYRNCGEALQDPRGYDGPVREKIDQFYHALKKAGSEMVAKGRVSEDTVKEIHIELMDDEAYMAEANRYWDGQIQETKDQ